MQLQCSENKFWKDVHWYLSLEDQKEIVAYLKTVDSENEFLWFILEIAKNAKQKDVRTGMVFYNRINEKTNRDYDLVQYTPIETNQININTDRTKGITSHINLKWRLIQANPDIYKTIQYLIGGAKEFHQYPTVESMQVFEQTNDSIFGNIPGKNLTDTAIRISVSELLDVTEIKFYTLDQVMIDLGGLAIICKAVIFLLVSIFLKNKWLDSIVEEVEGPRRNR